MLQILRPLLLLLCALPWVATAQQPPAPVEEAARTLLEYEARQLPGQIEIEVGSLDPANRLPQCAELGAFLPAGTRAWGAINIAVRCESPVTWTVYLPARVAVITDYILTSKPLRPGQIIGPDDLRLERGDLASQPAGTLTDASQAIGVHARQALAADQPLRRDQLRLPPVVQQGQTVRIVGTGSGFNVSAEGRAMNRAGDGETVRVRLPGGQIVSGLARPGGVVEVRF